MQSHTLNISDPVYGFISLSGLLPEIVSHPLFQRLKRIKQLGLSGNVYPGAQHTRFQHSLGAFYLMQEALRTLTTKGEFLFDSEIEAAEAAILMHDIGHGPFSHVLENVLVSGISHEEISLMMMQAINEDMKGQLNLAIKIFTGDYPKAFLNELICSQLDMDRMDYLCRDTFNTGVREGNIGCDRIIRMLNLKDGHLVVESKGLYSIENYLMARRLMYWQVYLHKTAVAAEEVLLSALRRAKYLASQGKELFCSPALHYFLYNHINAESFRKDEACLRHYATLDDSDIVCALKVWQDSDDKLLRILSSDFINRRLFKVEVCDNIENAQEKVDELQKCVEKEFGISAEEADYFVAQRIVEKEMYSATSDGIRILYPDGEVKDISDVSVIVNSESKEHIDRKLYLFRQRFTSEL